MVDEINADADYSEDGLLGGRILLTQPRRGYRVAIDPIFLAAAVDARTGHHVLDAGMGTGAAALCLAARVPDCRIVGLESHRELQRLASHNVAANDMREIIDPLLGDIARPPPRVVGGVFDHVMTNPPYLPAAMVTAPAEPGRAAAHVESTLDLEAWIISCLGMLRPRGTLTLIQRADRLDAILAAMHGRGGDVVVYPLWPSSSSPSANRIIIQARKGTKGPMRLARGLVLHEHEGGYTITAEAILRDAASLALRHGLSS